MSSRINIRKTLLYLLLICLGLAVLWTCWIQWRIHSASNQTLPVKVDVGIVLGASLWGDVPSPALRERLDHSIALYRQGLFNRIIVSGGLDTPESKFTEAQGMKDYLVKQGIPANVVVEENEARSTYQNLLFSKKLMQDHGWHSSIIITHAYHGARSEDIAHYLNYEKAWISTTGSKVLFMPWHKGRETLALTKWIAQKWSLLPLA
ncbi:YdcF family protein [Paenibacillus gansuensis]|uniref:YdcF family protein n=1 Tax=Paenibacillus gansuensis TaxID=306542 RepID=A0ABW5PA35_9BACL